MSGSWIYRDFGQDFGPVPFAQLQNLAASGTISRDCSVRSSDETTWKRAAQIDGLVFAEATPVSRQTGSDPNLSTKGADDWYYNVGGLELGPVTFDELLELGRSEQIAADDTVRLGANGKWRRVGSIGRLMAVLPFQAGEKIRPPSTRKSNPVITAVQPARPTSAVKLPATNAADSNVESATQADYQQAYEQAKENIAGLIIAQAEAVYKTSETQALAEIAWAIAPNLDSQWWGWMGSVEFGPIGFQQVFALVRNGQVKPTDFVRNGLLGQFVPAGSLPGVFNAATAIARANEALTLAKSQAKAAAELASPPPVAPQISKRPTPVREIAVVQIAASTPKPPSNPEPAASETSAERSANKASQTPAKEISQRDVAATKSSGKKSNPAVATVVQASPLADSGVDTLDLAKEALASRSIPGFNRIELEFHNGELTMRGSLASEGERLLALRVAGQVPGVKNVVDSLSVAQSGRMMAAKSAPVVVAARPVQRSGPGFGAKLTESFHSLNLKYGVSAVAITGLLGFGIWSFAGSSRPVSVHPVKGRLTMNGEPLADATIVLHRIGHSKVPASLHPRARAKDDGTFALETFDPADGAPNGEFVATVCLTKVVESGGETVAGPNLLPALYSRPDTSPLKIKITPSTKELQPLELVEDKAP